MKGLLLKEFYFYKANGVFYLILIVLFAICAIGSGNPFMMTMPMLISYLLPSSNLAYDEKSKWAQYCDALPVTRVQFVSVKYITMIVFYVFFCILTAVSIIINAAIGGFKDLTGLKLILPCFALYLILLGVISIIMPFLFKLGVEKGRFMFMVFGGLCGGLGAMGVSFGTEKGVTETLGNITASGAWIMAAAVAVSLLIFAGSWALSGVFYRGREL